MAHINVEIRRATLADLEGVCTLAQALNALHHEAWPRLFAPTAKPSNDLAHWRESIEAQHCVTFIATRADKMLGFVSAAIATESHSLFQPLQFVRVNSVCVADAVRGQGIGKQLMAQVEAWATAMDAMDIRLVVWTFNKDAIGLYEELGYVIRSHTMGKQLPIRNT